MGLKPPEFSPADNPASDSDSLMTRMLTYAYLPFLNFLLLIFPAYLSFDWSMEAVKLVESPQDPRNICSLALYSIITYALFSVLKNVNSTHLKSLKKNICNGNGVHHIEVKSPCGSQCKQSFKSFNHKEGSNGLSNGINASHANDLIQMGFRTYLSHNKRYQLMLIGFLLLIFPFIPATNLFFYVGFVVAERVLYIPSMGFCILVAQGFEVVVVAAGKNCRHLVHWAVAWLIVMYSCRTVIRNRDWLTEESLYRSGISVNPAKGKYFVAICSHFDQFWRVESAITKRSIYTALWEFRSVTQEIDLSQTLLSAELDESWLVRNLSVFFSENDVNNFIWFGVQGTL